MAFGGWPKVDLRLGAIAGADAVKRTNRKFWQDAGAAATIHHMPINVIGGHWFNAPRS